MTKLPFREEPLPVDSIAPVSALARIDGDRPRAVPAPTGASLLVFFKHDCETTVFSLPFVERMRQRIEAARAPTQVIGIAQDPPEVAARLLAELGIRMEVSSESEPYSLSGAYGVRFVPTLFLVAPDGRIRRVVEGFDRSGFEAIAREAGGGDALFTERDGVPALRPG